MKIKIIFYRSFVFWKHIKFYNFCVKIFILWFFGLQRRFIFVKLGTSRWKLNFNKKITAIMLVMLFIKFISLNCCIVFFFFGLNFLLHWVTIFLLYFCKKRSRGSNRALHVCAIFSFNFSWRRSWSVANHLWQERVERRSMNDAENPFEKWKESHASGRTVGGGQSAVDRMVVIDLWFMK